MRNDRVVKGGMGSFLTPPYHPSQIYNVEIDIRRKKENRGSCNIEYALEQDYISIQTKEEIRYILKEWEANTKLPLESAEVQKWVGDCKKLLGRNATEHIQKYYPNYKNINT